MALKSVTHCLHSTYKYCHLLIQPAANQKLRQLWMEVPEPTYVKAGLSFTLCGLGLFLLKTGLDGLRPYSPSFIHSVTSLPPTWFTAPPVQGKLGALISWPTPYTFLLL